MPLRLQCSMMKSAIGFVPISLNRLKKFFVKSEENRVYLRQSRTSTSTSTSRLLALDRETETHVIRRISFASLHTQQYEHTRENQNVKKRNRKRISYQLYHHSPSSVSFLCGGSHRTPGGPQKFAVGRERAPHRLSTEQCHYRSGRSKKIISRLG